MRACRAHEQQRLLVGDTNAFAMPARPASRSAAAADNGCYASPSDMALSANRS